MTVLEEIVQKRPAMDRDVKRRRRKAIVDHESQRTACKNLHFGREGKACDVCRPHDQMHDPGQCGRIQFVGGAVEGVSFAKGMFCQEGFSLVDSVFEFEQYIGILWKNGGNPFVGISAEEGAFRRTGENHIVCRRIVSRFECR